MIAAPKGVRQGAGSLERAISVDHRPFQHALLFSISFEAVVGARPDAFLVADFAAALLGTAARPIALVLGALRFGAQVSDFRQRTIAAIAAVVREHFQSVLGPMENTRQFGGALDDLIEGLSRPEAGAAFFECQTMDLPVRRIRQGRGRTLLLPPQVFAVDLGGTQAGLGFWFKIVNLARLEKTDLARELPPIVGPEGLQSAEDFFVVFQAEMASQVHAAISEAPRDRALLGGKLERKGAPAVGRGGMFFHQAKQRSEERRVGKECRSRWSPYH